MFTNRVVNVLSKYSEQNHQNMSSKRMSVADVFVAVLDDDNEDMNASYYENECDFESEIDDDFVDDFG